MIGGIIGDMVGSAYEHASLKGYSLPLLTRLSKHTDDSILILATADAIINRKPRAATLRAWFWENKGAGYSPEFYNWCIDEGAPPSISTGNGAAVRGVAVGHLTSSVQQAAAWGAQAAQVSHQTDEAIRHTQAVSAAVYLAKHGYENRHIEEHLLKKFGINVSSSAIPKLKDLHKHYDFDSSCAGSVPIAIWLGLNSINFSDCMRKGLYIGGDTDTILAIAGGIAANRHPIPHDLQQEVIDKLPEHLISKMREFI
jgi:ADP-ribosylglycohydrolase